MGDNAGRMMTARTGRLVSINEFQQPRRIEISSGGRIKDNGQAKYLRNAFASAHINVLLGSAFSIDTVPTLGNRESWFQAVDEHLRDCSKDDSAGWLDARALLRIEYFASIMEPLRGARATPYQMEYICSECQLVKNRGATTLPKRVNIFTTNYDPLIEQSLENLRVPFNDGFIGRSKPRFDPSSFSRLMCEQSLFMEYVSQVTTANVLKMHGSLTWRRSGQPQFGEIVYSDVDKTLNDCLEGCDGVLCLPSIPKVHELVSNACEGAQLKSLKELADNLSPDDMGPLRTFAERYDSILCIVNPAKRKFEETVLEQSYYDLLRIYANELDRNNALLLVFGFSFADEHILELTKRAIQSNPRVIVLISCHTISDADRFQSLFSKMNNVFYLVPEDGNELGLEDMSKVLRCAVR